MKRTLVMAAFAAAASLSFGQIYDNGPFVTHPGGGFGGADASRLQNSSLGMTILGFGVGAATNVFLTDNFVVPTGQVWNITQLTVWGYQTNAASTNLMTDLRIQIIANDPNTGSVVFGDTTTNRLASSAFSGVYRDTETSVGNGARAIQRVTGNVGTSLGPGTYWVSWGLVGSFNPAGAVFAPPVTITGLRGKPGGDGRQSTTGGAVGSYSAALIDANTPQDMPFLLHGTVVPEPASMAALGLGALALLRRRRK
jgi:hypothetical protein